MRKKLVLLVALFIGLFTMVGNAQRRKIVEVGFVYDTAAIYRMDKYVSYSILATRANGKHAHTTGYFSWGWLGRGKVPVHSTDVVFYERQWFMPDYRGMYRRHQSAARIRVDVPKNPTAGKDFYVPIPYPQTIDIQLLTDSAYMQYGSSIPVSIKVHMSNGQKMSNDNQKLAGCFSVVCNGVTFSKNCLSQVAGITGESASFKVVFDYDTTISKTVVIPVYPRGNRLFNYSGINGRNGHNGSSGSSGSSRYPNGESGSNGSWGENGYKAVDLFITVERKNTRLDDVYEVTIDRSGSVEQFLYEFRKGDRITVKANGGNGGNGGHGGDGGAGKDGTTENNNPGYGGNGGDGGYAGHGGDGAYIQLTVPKDAPWIADHFVFENKGGSAGAVGKGGSSGRGGYDANSSIWRILFTGRRGNSGNEGISGQQGLDGSVQVLYR